MSYAVNIFIHITGDHIFIVKFSLLGESSFPCQFSFTFEFSFIGQFLFTCEFSFRRYRRVFILNLRVSFHLYVSFHLQ